MNNYNADAYDADYFLRGKETGKSLYENYRWMPDLTIPMAKAIVARCGISPEDVILDFGCARGYTVRALRECGYQAYGYDHSEWAIENGDPAVLHYLTRIRDLALPPATICYDWIIAKDVLEHIPHVLQTIRDLMAATRKGLFIVVPLSAFDGSGASYVIPSYDEDKTHCQHYTLMGWASMFARVGWAVEAMYRCPGVKDNYYKPGWERGNGFFIVRRVEG